MIRAHQRATARFLVEADIARFYHSVYTHSIPWALHSKKIAKADRSLGLIGNAVDLWVRNAQDGQTMGIPIGPDTSLVIGELLLSAADNALEYRVDDLRGFRFMDDYELVFSSRHAAEFALGHLQEVMAEYELALSDEKTSVVELPSALEYGWNRALRDYTIRESGKGQATDLVGFFDHAYALAAAHPGKTVLAYALGRLRSEEITSDNWELYQALLLHTVLAEPGTTALVLGELQDYEGGGLTIDGTALNAVIDAQIQRHSPIGHGSEVAWALWAAIRFSLSISEEAAQSISTINDSVVALLALDAQNRGLIEDGLDTADWEAAMSADELYGENWLLAYEASLKGWLPSGQDHIAQDSNFQWLRAQGVSFYDTSSIALPAPPTTAPEYE